MLLGCEVIEGIITYHTLLHKTIRMDYYPDTLKSLLLSYKDIDNRNIRLNMFSTIIRQLLLGLAVLYDNDCCHADITPKNILIGSSDLNNIKVVLTDFGSMIKIDKIGFIKNTKNNKTHSTYMYAARSTRGETDTFTLHPYVGCVFVRIMFNRIFIRYR